MNIYPTYIILFGSAALSGLAVLFFKLNFSKNIRLLISFSGAFLLAISVLHLIPEIYSNYTEKIGIFILVGFLLQLLLEFFSGGIEHGHFHTHNKSLIVFPFAIFISLCIHSFIEGMALIDPHDHHHHTNYSLLTGIIIHKIPIAIVLSTMLVSKNLSRTTFIIALLIFSISAPLGLFIASNSFLDIAGSPNIILALAVGIFLHISTTILFETSEGHKFDLKKFVIIVLGFTIAAITL
ncbi:MAG: ZIP family metal transporter [Vicingaceae bacterium]|nr:ZIP family metal transporter [Vicingaceae bacterium]